MGTQKYPIQNPKSKIQNLKRQRRGLSYLEVLIAAGIALTGILGAVALYPVAIVNLQRGQVVDTIATIGPSALRSAEAVGVTHTSNWLAYEVGTQRWSHSMLAIQPFMTATPSPPTDLPGRPGLWHSLCFDPRFAAESSPVTGGAGFAPNLFPFTPTSNVNDVRMARLTLRGAPGTSNFNPMSVAQARNLFKVSDDLIFDRPTDDMAPAVQLPIQRDDMADVRRNYMADYEYIITLTPSLRGIPVGYLPNDTTPYSYRIDGMTIPNEPMPLDTPSEYTMSAVVFHKRQVALNAYIPGDREEPEAERVADVIDFWNGGINGGDVTIQARSGAFDNELEVHSGDWVLLSGNMYSASGTRKFMGPLFQWYRVASANGDAYRVGVDLRRDLTLDGPDWPVSLMPGFNPPFTGVQLTIVSGVVGVFNTPVQLK